MYEYRARINRVVDGDTVDVDIELGFNIVLTGERVRIMGIDTPESRTSDEVEKDGDDAKGKFGRILGDFVAPDGRMVTEVLIEEGHCVPYFGGSKEEVQAQHYANRQRLLSEGIVSQEAFDKATKKMKD